MQVYDNDDDWYDEDDFVNGEKIIYEFYGQTGGLGLKQSFKSVTTIFSDSNRAAFTRALRGTLRTVGGLSSDILTVGAGGDIMVNSIFAIQNSLTFITELKDIVALIRGAQKLFSKLFKIRFKSIIPIYPKLRLDNGLSFFEKKFTTILEDYVSTNNPKILDKIHSKITSLMDRITTVVSDWIACLFPNTAGLAGEISKTVLDYVVTNGFTYTYNLISIIPSKLQQMITNPYALTRLIKKVLRFLKKVLRGLGPKEIKKIIASLGKKADSMTTNPLFKQAIGFGIGAANKAVSIGSKAAKVKRITNKFVPRTQDIIIYVIDKFIEPNVKIGVNLFYQLFPIYLMFVLFIEKYPKLRNKEESNDDDGYMEDNEEQSDNESNYEETDFDNNYDEDTEIIDI